MKVESHPVRSSPTQPMITLEPISPANALVFKAIRLRALETDPSAFGSTYAKESAFPDDEWFRRSVRWSSDGFAAYLAFDQDLPCGLVGCYAEEEAPERGHVVSMWVDPLHRRSGVGRFLIDGLKAWALARGMRELKLMVTSVNPGAIRFYEKLGFRKTGVTGPYPNDPTVIEYEMILKLDPNSAHAQ
jgi:ribosomal protein S18 acetylase RimI-like enzyme